MKNTILDNLIDDVLTGGNHLACALIGMGCLPAEYSSYPEVLEKFGQPCADLWVIWRSIGNLSEYRRSFAGLEK